MNLFCGVDLACRTCDIEGRRRIGNDESLKPEVSRHPCRGGNAVRSCQSSDDQGVMMIGTQKLLQIRPDECAVDMFLDDGLPGVRFDQRFELTSLCLCMERRLRIEGEMLDVNDGASRLSPSPKQSCDVLLSVGVVARTPLGLVEALLHINDEQNCIWR